MAKIQDRADKFIGGLFGRPTPQPEAKPSPEIEKAAKSLLGDLKKRRASLIGRRGGF